MGGYILIMFITLVCVCTFSAVVLVHVMVLDWGGGEDRLFAGCSQPCTTPACGQHGTGNHWMVVVRSTRTQLNSHNPN